MLGLDLRTLSFLLPRWISLNKLLHFLQSKKKHLTIIYSVSSNIPRHLKVFNLITIKNTNLKFRIICFIQTTFLNKNIFFKGGVQLKMFYQ